MGPIHEEYMQKLQYLVIWNGYDAKNLETNYKHKFPTNSVVTNAQSMTKSKSRNILPFLI